MNQALIIFAKLPTAGNVKTRLAATIGNAMALRIYYRLLEHTRTITRNLPVHKYLYYDSDTLDQCWPGYELGIQHGSNLGEKMNNAMNALFQKGYQRIVIIGSDCFELQEDQLYESYAQLETHDICIGPATDGGYYLLALKNPFPQLFENIAWSSNKVLDQTIRICNQQNQTIHLLPILSDIDCEEDLTPELKAILF